MDILRRVPIFRLRMPARGPVPTRPQRPYTHLRRADRALAEALDQLASGVPLNWAQVAEDPALLTLERLQSIGAKCRATEPGVAPHELRSDLETKLADLLPPPRPVPTRQVPKSLAGFSEDVLVPTQAEESVPSLLPTIAPRVGIAILLVAAIAFVIALVPSVAQLFQPSMQFRWITVVHDARQASSTNLPRDWSMPACRDFRLDDPAAVRKFLAFPDVTRLQGQVGFPMMFLPLRLSEPSTYTLRLTDAGISPCLSGAPDPADRGALVKLNYIARHPLNDGSGTLSPLVVFEGREIPVTINVTAGEWKEVRSGESHGVYWRGGPYTDVEGTVWIGDVSVLVLERGDLVFTMIGQPGQGVTREMLQSVVGQLEKEAAAAAAPPMLKWIEMRRNDQVISRKDDSAPEPLDCRTPTSVDPLSRRADVRVDSLSNARQMVGFHALTLPVSGTLPANLFHFELKSVTVRACLGAELQPKDPGARLRQGFQGQTLAANTATQIDISLFQQQQQPLTLNVTGGAWRAVSVGDWQGVYWQGSGFRDPSGIDWITDASVLMLERGNDIVTLAGRPDQGVTDELLVPLAAAMK